MKRVAKLRARTEKYTDRKTGQEKQGYMTVGSILERDDGSRMFKLDSIPVNFDGWLFEGELDSQRTKDQAGLGNGQQQRQAPAGNGFEDEDLPF